MLRRLTYILCGITFGLASCKHDPPIPVDNSGNYPKDVANIIINKCATAGCHNAASHQGDLVLDTWENMFKGGANGAAVVPFSTDFSPLLYFINTDTALGVVSEPRMPDGQDAQPLSKDEYLTIRDWVAAGAPNKNGQIPFSENAATRQKIYMTQQGCDLIAVIDAQTQIIMRYIKIGTLPGSESPHCVRFSGNGKYAFVSFTAGNVLQKIDATTDQIIASTPLGQGAWNIVLPSEDGSKVMVSDLSGGKLTYINYETNQTKTFVGYTGAHGIASNPTFDTFYVTAQTGNAIYKMVPDVFVNKETISIDGQPANTLSASKDPHEIMMTPDYSKYFLTCERSNEVRVLDRHTNQLLKVFNVGAKPQEIAISTKKPYLFVTCMEDPSPASNANVTYKGSVYVINYNTLEVLHKIEGKFSGAHGISVDDKNELIYIASRNLPVGNGPLPHHTSTCGGSNGYYSVYDLNTWQPATAKRYEVTPDPYSVSTRFQK